MSWNTVRRAAALGYQNIYWLSEGTDGWTDWGGDLVDECLSLLGRSPRAHRTRMRNNSTYFGIDFAYRVVHAISAR